MAAVARLPRSILVMGQRFRVGAVKNLQLAPGDAEGDRGDEPMDVLGLTDNDMQVIQIEVIQGEDLKRETLLHECLHAMLAKAGFGLDMEPAQNEAIVKRLSPVLLDFLRRNPAVYTYVTGRYTYR